MQPRRNRHFRAGKRAELMAAWRHAKIMQPALFIAGDCDAVIARSKAALDRMPQTVPNLRKLVMLPGCGHRTQREWPAEVNAELLAFLKALSQPGGSASRHLPREPLEVALPGRRLALEYFL